MFARQAIPAFIVVGVPAVAMTAVVAANPMIQTQANFQDTVGGLQP